MSIGAVLTRARRWWWILVLGPLVAAGATYLISSAMTPIYRANTTLLIEESPSSGAADYNSILAAERRTRTFSRLVSQRPILEETIRRLGLPLTPEQMAGEITVTPVRDTQLVTLAVEDPNPSRAARIANTISDVFIEQTSQQAPTGSGPSPDEVQQNIDAVKTQINDLAGQVAGLKGQPNASDPAVQAQIGGIQAQIAQLQQTYGTLLEVQQHLAEQQSASGPHVRVTERAAAPAVPVRPRTALNTILGGVLGALLAVGFVTVMTYVDDTVKDPDDVRQLIGKATLGSIPRFQAQAGLDPVVFPRSAATEGFRSLRTNLQFATVGVKARSLVFTSYRPGDGKTSTVASLGAVLAQAGQQVILVDADLRKPRLHTLFNHVTNRTGLTNLLLAETDAGLDPLLQWTEVPGLRVLATGPLPPNPPDVLGSERMWQIIARLEQMADIVLIDTPPLALSDALVLSGMVDGIILVTLSGRTRSKELVRAVDQLANVPSPLLGVVLNRVNHGSDAYYYYQAYYDSEPTISGGGGSTPGSPPKVRRRLGSRLAGWPSSLTGREN